MDRGAEKTKRQMRKRGAHRRPDRGREEETDKVIVSFYDGKTAREICAARMTTHPTLLAHGYLDEPGHRLASAMLFRHSGRDVSCGIPFEDRRNTAIAPNGYQEM